MSAATRTMIEVDRQIVAGNEKGHALQVQGTITFVALALLQKQILAFIDSQHGAAQECAGFGVLRKQNRIVRHQMRKFRDHYRYKALIVAQLGRRLRPGRAGRDG